MTTLNKFHLTTSDNRKRARYKKLEKDVSVLMNMEPGKPQEASVLVVFSYSGYMITKKLYDEITRFSKTDRKCYIYSEYSRSVREIINVERGDFPDTGIHAVIISSGMKISEYKKVQPNIITEF